MSTAVRYRVAVPVGAGRLPAARARSCHSLTVRVADGAAAPRTVGGIRLWHESVPAASSSPAAQARRDTEAGRPLALSGPPVRAVLLRYADGPADLVLVARRAALSERELRELAVSLPGGTGPDAPAVADRRATPAGGERPRVAWGLGEPSRTGRTGTAGVEIKAQEPSDELLLAAVGLVLARYSAGEDTAVAVFDPEDTDGGTPVFSVPVDEDQDAAAYVAQWHATDGVPLGDRGPVPTVGVYVSTQRPGVHYRPFLAPPLPLVLHWRREADRSVSGVLSYDEGETDPGIARAFARHVAHVAEQLADRGRAVGEGGTLAGVDLMSEGEALETVDRGVTASVTAPGTQDRTIHGLFAEVARSRPDAPAVVEGDTRLSYAQLDERAERIARGLRLLGVVPGGLVGVAMDRTAELVATLLGILKAGGAYVPMDIRYPEERLRYTVDSAGMRIVVGAVGTFPRIEGVKVISPADLIALADRAADELPPLAEDGSAAAYTIFTSGSTGRPKGVVVPHRNVAALVEGVREDFELNGSDVWTFFHSSAFDFSVWEIWGCLLTGGELVVVPYWVTRDTELFYDLVVERGVTVLSQTPSAFAQFIEADGRLRSPLALRLVVFGGEPLDVSMLAPWFARHSHTRCRLSNMFGITETTVHVTEQTVKPADVVARTRSVGRAMPGWSLSVRDPRGRVLPAGASGEIYVGGAGVAQGYLHQPELTAQRFVDDPYGSGRIYRSGDRGRLRPDGRLDHLGRLDNQVKIRGHRIELDEIRNVLLGHPAVSGAAVVLRYETPGDTATARIDAYVSLGDASVSEADVSTHAGGVLPDYMMPASVTRVDAIPLTINGKVDTAALPEPAVRGNAAGGAAAPAAGPADPLADEVLALWSRILSTEVGPGDNFFELGGNSLLVIRLLREMRDRGLPRVSTQDFYRNSVATQFIQLVRGANGGN
ncbi:non-ribosomal peptide synthetase [Streptomyces sp. PTY087I2]|uniref:non-ribosomal peptide synthetase n=1 Tax=Streptomyces sp. PTY087I2 TaxID=1819298 RepID=UPI0008283793|nr:non-ribosomal peptide synthetase [Streptomyces sp. PTY087I2]OCC07754.1 Dimodular nonribosomal peptide synthase [Streptomyces sp. PTY087I2]